MKDKRVRRSKRVRPTLTDADNPEWTDEMFKRAKRVEDIPALAHLTKRKPGERGPQKAPTKEAISIRLDKDVVAHYRAKGEGWQARINKDLRTAARLK